VPHSCRPCGPSDKAVTNTDVVGAMGWRSRKCVLTRKQLPHQTRNLPADGLLGTASHPPDE
jgi:hypothetical protein